MRGSDTKVFTSGRMIFGRVSVLSKIEIPAMEAGPHEHLAKF
jgi:hypothetical protein